jgi:hypothetical protein
LSICLMISVAEGMGVRFFRPCIALVGQNLL